MTDSTIYSTAKNMITSKQYMDTVASLGCIITGKPAELHHPRCLGSAGKKSSDWHVVPLSTELHRLYHENPSYFEMKCGRESALSAMTIRAVVQRLAGDRIPF